MIKLLLIRDYSQLHGEHLWLGFPPDARPEEARCWFAQHFGYQPPAVRRHGSKLLLVGPLAAQEKTT